MDAAPTRPARAGAGRTAWRPRVVSARCAAARRSSPRSRRSGSARARRRSPCDPKRGLLQLAARDRRHPHAGRRPAHVLRAAGRDARSGADRRALARRRARPDGAAPLPGSARWRVASGTDDPTSAGTRAAASGETPFTSPHPRYRGRARDRVAAVGGLGLDLAPRAHRDEAGGERARRQDGRAARRRRTSARIGRSANRPSIRRSSRFTRVSRPRGLWIA